MLDFFQAKGHQLVALWDKDFAEDILSVHGHPQFAFHLLTDRDATYDVQYY